MSSDIGPLVVGLAKAGLLLIVIVVATRQLVTRSRWMTRCVG
jgi:hypothetical protein